MKKFFKCGLVLASALVINPSFAIAQEANQEQSQEQTVRQEEQVEPQRFISDGTSIVIPKTEAKITPVSGWEVITSTNMSVIMQEPEVEKTADNIKYQRNITLALIQNPSFIDEARMEKFVEELKENFGKSSSNYTIAESKLFDLGNQKAIMVYAAYTLNEIDLMQLNILVSDSSKQYMITYTDLASRFTNEATFNKAWASMTSLELNSVPVNPYSELLKYAIAFIALLTAIVVVLKLRKRSALKLYEQEANSIYQDDEDAQWDLNDNYDSLESTRIDKNDHNNEEEIVTCSGFEF